MDAFDDAIFIVLIVAFFGASAWLSGRADSAADGPAMPDIDVDRRRARLLERGRDRNVIRSRFCHARKGKIASGRANCLTELVGRARIEPVTNG